VWGAAMAHNKKLSDVDNSDTISLKGVILPRFGSVPFHRVVQKFQMFCKAQDYTQPNPNPRPKDGEEGHDDWEAWVYPEEHRAVGTLADAVQRG
jgi:hypothetical protein